MFDNKTSLEQARWIALFYAINIIEENCEKFNNKHFENIFKTFPIKKYIDEITPSLEKKIEQLKNINF